MYLISLLNMQDCESLEISLDNLTLVSAESDEPMIVMSHRWHRQVNVAAACLSCGADETFTILYGRNRTIVYMVMYCRGRSTFGGRERGGRGCLVAEWVRSINVDSVKAPELELPTPGSPASNHRNLYNWVRVYFSLLF